MKRKIKILILLFFIGGINVVYGQLATTDPAALAQSVKNGIETAKVVSNTTQMIDMLNNVRKELKEAQEILQEINAGLQTIIWTKQIYRRQVMIIDLQREMSVRASKMKNLSPEELLRLNNQLQTVVSGADALLGTVTDILTPAKMKMTDYERMTSLKELDKVLSFQQTIMKIQFAEMQMINEEREIRRTIKMIN